MGPIISHQPKESRKRRQFLTMPGSKNKGKTRQGGVNASTDLNRSNIGPGFLQQSQRKRKQVGESEKGRLRYEAAQAEKAIATPDLDPGSNPRSKPPSAVRDGIIFGGLKSVRPNPRSGNGGSSTDGPGHANFLYPSDADLDCVPVRAKLLRRFYEPLVLLRVLDPSRGSRIPRYTSDVACEEEELRRSFIDSVAYICDYKKGGDTFTAAAMQKEPAGVRIWLAANNPIQEKTLRFLHDVLDCLAAITVSNRASTEDSLAVRIIDFNKKRLETYKSFVRRSLRECLERLEKPRNCKCCPRVTILHA